jgi:hypothetical protein
MFEKRRYATAQMVFGVLFVLFTILVLVLVFTSGDRDDKTTAVETGPQLPSDSAIGIFSLLASVTTLIGFVSTTALQWRSERRAAGREDLERKRQELELEKLRLELEEMREAEEE